MYEITEAAKAEKIAGYDDDKCLWLLLRAESVRSDIPYYARKLFGTMPDRALLELADALDSVGDATSGPVDLPMYGITTPAEVSEIKRWTVAEVKARYTLEWSAAGGVQADLLAQKIADLQGVPASEIDLGAVPDHSPVWDGYLGEYELAKRELRNACANAFAIAWEELRDMVTAAGK